MFDKKNLLFFAISWTVTFALINYFFPSKKNDSEIKNGDIVTIDKEKITKEPSKFIPKISVDESINRFIDVEVSFGTITFDIATGSPSNVQYKNSPFSNKTLIIDDSSKNEPYTPQLLLLVDNNFPCHYSLIERTENEEQAILNFKDCSKEISIIKKYIINKKSGAINCNFIIDTKENSNVVVINKLSLQSHDQEEVAPFSMNRNNTIKTIQNCDIDNIVSINSKITGISHQFFINTIIEKNIYEDYIRTYFSKSHDTLYMFTETADNKNHHELSFNWYMGPKTFKHLKLVDEKLLPLMEYGWFGSLSQLLLNIIMFIFNNIIKNIGIAIILVALLIRLLFLPFALKSKDSVKKRAEFQKKYAHIQEKYKDDPERKLYEQTQLIKQYGIMPGGLAMIPMFLQIPLMIALQRLLKGSVLLHQVPFIGWMNDISLVDKYYILPFIATIFIYLQTMKNSKNMSPAASFGFLIFSVALFFLFSKFSIGILLFIASGTIFSYLQLLIFGV